MHRNKIIPPPPKFSPKFWPTLHTLKVGGDTIHHNFTHVLTFDRVLQQGKANNSPHKPYKGLCFAMLPSATFHRPLELLQHSHERKQPYTPGWKFVCLFICSTLCSEAWTVDQTWLMLFHSWDSSCVCLFRAYVRVCACMCVSVVVGPLPYQFAPTLLLLCLRHLS